MEKLSFKEKLFNLQNEVGAISKDESNPFYKSKYFDINGLIKHLQPLLLKNRLLLSQPILKDCVYSIILDVDSEENIESSISLTAITDPQKRGSEITYYRRYTLSSLLGLQAEDDDANKTLSKPAPAKATEKRKATSQNLIAWSQKGVSLDKLHEHVELTAKQVEEYKGLINLPK